MREKNLSDWATKDLTLKNKIVYGVIILLMFPLIYAFVYATGGIKFVYSHSMYIPILLAAIIFGIKGGVAAGIVAGILLGPLMPIEVATSEAQPFINWFFRLLIFVGTGTLVGYGVDRLKKSANRVKRMILYNPETGIPNTNAISVLCNDLPRGPKTIVTVLVSNNQDIIDALGTDAYNRILYTLYSTLKDSPSLVQAVVQSDTYKLWLVKNHNNLKEDAEAIMKVINQNQFIDDAPVYLDVSIGVSLIHDEKACKTLESYRISDSLAREAHKKNLPYAIKNEDLNRKIKDYDLISRFSESFYKQELSLAFQTQVDLITGKPFAVEALLRWKHPRLGDVSPSEFIPLIEETKLIHPLTTWVIENAFKAMKQLEENGNDIDIAINISAKNLYDPDFYQRVMKSIEAFYVDPGKIIFEITESSLMGNPEKSKKCLNRFVDKGIRIAIDDFGAGYSSLAYLSRFPIDTIKIDKFFILQLTKDNSMIRIVKSTIKLANDLGYHVIAEGVEDKECANLLKELDGRFAQGYYYTKPMSLKRLMATLDEY